MLGLALLALGAVYAAFGRGGELLGLTAKGRFFLSSRLQPRLLRLDLAALVHLQGDSAGARRLLPDDWFERAIAEMGQSMGVTATGLLLLRVVDPEGRMNPGCLGL